MGEGKGPNLPLDPPALDKVFGKMEELDVTSKFSRISASADWTTNYGDGDAVGGGYADPGQSSSTGSDDYSDPADSGRD